jgi:hypothetical protein
VSRWLLFTYRLPAEPSAPRVAVWRALQKLPGAYLHDGAYLVAHGALAEVALESLAHDVRNDGGEASLLWVQEADDERHLQARLRAAKAGAEKRAR